MDATYLPTDRDWSLGLLVEYQALRDAVEIPEGFFSASAEQRAVWAAICELRAAGDPIQIATIAEKCPGNGNSWPGTIGYLSAITSGLIRIKPEEFRRRVYTQFAEDLKKRRRTLAAAGCPDEDEIASLSEEIRRLELEAEEGGPEHAPTSFLLSDVEAKSVPWLWQDYVPLGRATLISGDPGSAKTWFCLDLAARLSRGLPWADGARGTGPAKTYYLTVEDDLADTIRPRIDSLGGDPSMVAVFNSDHPLHMDLSTTEGLLRIEKELVRLENVQLVVVDPIIDFSGKSNPNAAEEVRTLLTPLIRLASKLNFALVLIGHLNKAQTMSAIYRAGGSTSGWLGKCRASFMIFRDIDEKALRHVIPIKANLAPQDPRQLEFRITSGRLDASLSIQDVDPDEQLNPQAGRKPREREDAVEWLKTLFGDKTEIPALEVEETAKVDHINQRTLARAKEAAGYRSVRRTDEDGKTFWAWSRMTDA